MKIQKRQGLFETNSSSTHAICIAKNEFNSDMKLPKRIEFKLGEFYGDVNRYNTLEEKASYLYSGYIQYKSNDFYVDDASNDEENVKTWREYDQEAALFFKDVIREILPEYECDFEMPLEVNKEFGIDDIKEEDEFHSFIFYILESKENLIAYLFNDISTIFTGKNDSPENDVNGLNLNEILPMDKIAKCFYR